MGHDMGQVMGGLMSAIAEARSISDRTSRDLALQYEKDELMRVFPVPCVELETVEMNLKFAMEEAPDLQDTQSVSSHGEDVAREKELVYGTAERTRSKVVEAMTSTLRKLFTFTKAYDAGKVGDTIAKTVVEAIGNPTHVVIATKPKGPIKLESFDVRHVATKILYELIEIGYVTLTKNNLSTATNELVKVLGSVAIEHERKAVELRDLVHRDVRLNQFPLNLLLQHSELAGLPAECISSIKITVNVANYEWTKVEERNGTSFSKLVRE
ncbi:hypothetical protein EV586_1253 [Tumebacillus sp. BK434]|uniref:hypothetical protein n=1 Tax=Tumebacillus sp. BK434 TaxID=2512169 RepID=UPI00104D79BE|nr:hypothetical protein [Tumebacillus sp. BK434]TCP49424.1 hypothetical protein EV586_1253 [Tumebacillus sp. BK434]